MTDRSSTVLAVDIGGTKIAFADVENGRIARRRQVQTPRTGRGADLVEVISTEISQRSPSRLAVATTGIVSDGRLTALNPSTLPIEDGFPLAHRIEEATGLRPLLVNDAQAAAWGEYRFGAGRGTRNFLFVTVSTGVGGGLILDGRPQVGPRGLAGHIGHLTVPGAVAACGCGRKGCLETIASGTAISTRFRERCGRDLGAPEIFEAAAAGDAVAESILDEAAQALAAALANVVASVDLDLIALGGGAGLGRGFLDRVLRSGSRLPAAFRREVVPVRSGPDAGLIGVATLYEENFH